MRLLISSGLTVAMITAVGFFAIPQDAEAQGVLKRLSAEWNEGGEQATATTANPLGFPVLPDGTAIYSKTVFTGSASTLYVTFETQGDAHNGAANWFSCRIIDSAGPRLCDTPGGGGAAGAPHGWTSKNKHFNYNTTYTLPDGTIASGGDGGGGQGDTHDNSISHEWCAQVSRDEAVTVELRMATSDAGSTVFIENTNVYIDGSNGRPLCTEYTPPGGGDPGDD
jgi:hypothetical protein